MSAAAAIGRIDEAIGAGLDRVFAPAANPWRHLGSLAFLFFVVCIASGLYLYAVFDTSLAGAYESGRALDRTPLGRLIRGLHRSHALLVPLSPEGLWLALFAAAAVLGAMPWMGRRVPLASGIDLPQRTVATLRDELDRVLEAGGSPVVVFACTPAGLRAGAIAVECAAMVPPAFVQYALRHGARGVVIAGCREGDCEHRLGDRWIGERFTGLRAPALRDSVPRERVRVVFCGSDRELLDRALGEIDETAGTNPRGADGPR